MNEFWKTVLSSIGLSVGTCTFLGWLCREWISARLTKSIQHEYDKKLEEFKTKTNYDYELKLEEFKTKTHYEYELKLESSKRDFQNLLDERQTRFKYWHDMKARAIKELYTDACDLYFSLVSFYLFDRRNKKMPLDEERSKKRNEMKDKISSSVLSVAQKWYGLRIFLDNEEDKAFKSFGLTANNWSKLLSDKHTEELFEKESKLHREIKDAITKLRESFHEALCVETMDSQKQKDCVQKDPIDQNEPSEQKPSTE